MHHVARKNGVNVLGPDQFSPTTEQTRESFVYSSMREFALASDVDIRSLLEQVTRSNAVVPSWVTDTLVDECRESLENDVQSASPASFLVRAEHDVIGLCIVSPLRGIDPQRAVQFVDIFAIEQAHRGDLRLLAGMLRTLVKNTQGATIIANAQQTSQALLATPRAKGFFASLGYDISLSYEGGSEEKPAHLVLAPRNK